MPVVLTYFIQLGENQLIAFQKSPKTVPVPNSFEFTVASTEIWRFRIIYRNLKE